MIIYQIPVSRANVYLRSLIFHPTARFLNSFLRGSLSAFPSFPPRIFCSNYALIKLSSHHTFLSLTFPFRHYELYSYESRAFCRLLQKSPCLRAPREYIVETFNIRAPLYLPLSLSRLFLSLATCRYVPHTRTHTAGTHIHTLRDRRRSG